MSATQTFSVLEVVSAGTVKLKPVPSVLAFVGAPPLCCRPVRTAAAAAMGEPFDHENANGCGATKPRPRNGIAGPGLTFTRLLMLPPPDLRTSGASVVLQDPSVMHWAPAAEKPQTAQSAVPSAVRSTLAAGAARPPTSDPPLPEIGVHAESSDVPSGPVAVAMTAWGAPAPETYVAPVTWTRPSAFVVTSVVPIQLRASHVEDPT